MSYIRLDLIINHLTALATCDYTIKIANVIHILGTRCCSIFKFRESLDDKGTWAIGSIEDS